MEKDKDKIIEELRDRVAFLTEDPAAEFYTAFKEAIKNLTRKMKDGTLDLIVDVNQKSILLLAEKSDKIFAGLAKGKEMIEEKKTEEAAPSKKAEKSQTTAFKL
jgi:hypothetical protein